MSPLLSAMRKAQLTAGASLWWTIGAPEIGLEPIKVSDGPHGIRGERFDERDIAPCTPCGTALAATVGAGATAELGAMRISEEVDALEVIGIRSVTYLASTRVLAGRSRSYVIRRTAGGPPNRRRRSLAVLSEWYRARSGRPLSIAGKTLLGV